MNLTGACGQVVMDASIPSVARDQVIIDVFTGAMCRSPQIRATR